MHHRKIIALIAYCETKAVTAQKLSDTYERLGCASNAAKQLGIVEAMADMQQKLRRCMAADETVS